MMVVHCVGCVASVSCYVKLHGYGNGYNGWSEPDWYAAVAVNGVEYLNITDEDPATIPGIFMYNVDPSSCSASDFHHFNTHNSTGSLKLMRYLQALKNGEFVLTSQCSKLSSS